MKKITISADDLYELFLNEKTKKYALHIMEFCKNSKYGYGSKCEQENDKFYYVEVDDKFVKTLCDILTENANILCGVDFTIQLIKKLKSKNDDDNNIW